jgi:hypothetical protein
MTTHKPRKRRQVTLNAKTPSEPAWTVVVRDGDELAQLRELTALRRSARLAEEILVGRARDLGVSWSTIGAALEMSAQGAQQRHGDTYH